MVESSFLLVLCLWPELRCSEGLAVIGEQHDHQLLIAGLYDARTWLHKLLVCVEVPWIVNTAQCQSLPFRDLGATTKYVTCNEVA